MRLLIAPLAAAKRCKTSAHWSFSFSARSTLSSWPMTFLVLLTKSNFSRDRCDMALDLPYGGMVSEHSDVAKRPSENRERQMEISIQEPEPPGSSHFPEVEERV